MVSSRGRSGPGAVHTPVPAPLTGSTHDRHCAAVELCTTLFRSILDMSMGSQSPFTEVMLMTTASRLRPLSPSAPPPPASAAPPPPEGARRCQHAAALRPRLRLRSSASARAHRRRLQCATRAAAARATQRGPATCRRRRLAWRRDGPSHARPADSSDEEGAVTPGPSTPTRGGERDSSDEDGPAVPGPRSPRPGGKMRKKRKVVATSEKYQ